MKALIRNYVNSLIWMWLAILSRLPVRWIRTGLLKLSGMQIDGAIVYGGFHVRKPSKIKIGNGSVIGHGVTLDGRNGITIGENVNFSSEVMVWTMQHDYDSQDFRIAGGEVVIGDYAWISARATILPNVKIGEGAVVAAGALVTKDVAPFSVVGGVPAKKIAVRRKDLNYSPAEGGGLPFV
ncbi:Virginiamycin A acetyltransferase [Microbulbifer aggregans]|uniref:Virginiamycin A acetyltransferase n=1 Tax=Microbulbifer aggregans TaxID=1769779 RepID=A0A1C9W7R5_9GAMM|nr:acyltransferase [Microbulbifer aggregans]AOS97199.1 Virginiamycin A acetyltransferase [Microbulbifer aggregans]